MLFGVLALSGVVLGFEKLWAWQFLTPFLAFALTLGQILKAVVGVLVLRDDLR